MWNALGLGEYFPGNALLWSDGLDILFSAGTMQSVLAAMQYAFSAKLGLEADDLQGTPDNSNADYTVIRDTTGKVVYVEEHVGLLEEYVPVSPEEPAADLIAEAALSLQVFPFVKLTGAAAVLAGAAMNEATVGAIATVAGLLQWVNRGSATRW